MAPTLDLALLGPLEARVGGTIVDLGGVRARSVLAALLVDANRVVTVDRLIAAAWGETAPTTARVQVQNRLSVLRRTFASSGGPPFIDRVGSSYVARVQDDQLDLSRFDIRSAKAEQLIAHGDLDGAHAALTAALALWRGPALDGLTTPHLEATAHRLEERRLHAVESRIEVGLARGEHTAVAAELAELVRTYPYRERLHALLMIALYRDGRQAESLEAFRRARAGLTEHLAVEPGPLLRRLHEAVLRSDHRLISTRLDAIDATATAAPPGEHRQTPHELPADVAGFAGRAVQLGALDRVLSDRLRHLAIAVITGTAGVGKTALAVHWGHRHAKRFPDGQLYVNLRGYSRAAPTRPIDALAALLRSLGTPPEQVPLNADEAAALYRSTLAERQVLVVLDNAGSADQVRPLLPGGPGSLVLVTSRRRLGGLVAREGAHRVELTVLDPDDASHLIVQILGRGRVAAEPAAAAELATICAYLPLAIRVAAANLVNHPHHLIGDHVRQLRGGNRLAALAVEGDEETAVRAAFDLSYRSISGPAQRLFRLVGLVPGADFTALAAAALTATTPDEAGGLLERLADAHLVDEPEPGRFAFHDLLREYARDLVATSDSDTDRGAALRRLFDSYLAGVDAAARLLYPERLRLPLPPPLNEPPVPGLAGPVQAGQWLDAERHNLVAAARHAADHGPRPVTWLLADGLRGYFWVRVHAVDWVTVAEAGLAAAIADDEPQAQACAHASLGDLAWQRSQFARAAEQYCRALVAARRAGWLDGQATALGNLGAVHAERGHLRRAERCQRLALALDERIGNAGRLGARHINLGIVNLHLGRFDRFAAHEEAALAMFRRTGSRNGEALALTNLGEAYVALGRLGSAREVLTEALAFHRATGSRRLEADTLRCLAETHRDAGRHPDALACAQAAVRTAEGTDEHRIECDARSTLGSVHLAAGDHDAAIEEHRRSMELSRRVGTDYREARSLIGLAAALTAAGAVGDAVPYAEQAVGIARRFGFLALEADGLTVLAEANCRAGEVVAAAADARRAVAIHETTGHSLGYARAGAALTHALAVDGSPSRP